MGVCVCSGFSQGGRLLSQVPPSCCQRISAHLFKQEGCQNVALENLFMGLKGTNKLKNARTRGASLILRTEDRAECLLRVQEGQEVGIMTSSLGPRDPPAFHSVALHVAVPCRDNISSSDLPPKCLLFQDSETCHLQPGSMVTDSEKQFTGLLL